MKKVYALGTALLVNLPMPAANSADIAAGVPERAKPAVISSPWDIAFGAAVMSDYVFRGITQSNHKPSVAGYFEPRYAISKDLQAYVGIAGESIAFPNRASGEIDFYGGLRPTFGALTLDIGAWYYFYPGGQCFNGTALAGVDADCLARGPIPVNGNVAKKDASFWEVYAKGTYALNESWTFGFNQFYTPSYANTGAYGDYLSATAKYAFPARLLPAGIGAYISGEFGRQWLGTSDSFYGAPVGHPEGIKYADYNTWNVGIGFTWKVFTLDLRYSDTNLSKGDCNALTGDFTASERGNVTPINPAPGFGSAWCGSTFIAKLGADLSLDSLK
ncbi:MAG: TorF family putative porin [Pseudorhodoplanes sp.]